MLVQARGDRLRLIRQHDHALAAGALARAWRGPAAEAPGLPFRVILATGLHDLAWRELDAEPLYDPERRRPYLFDDVPLPRKLAAYRAGLSRMEEISPWAGLLGSLHYASFLDADRAADFLEAEEERQERLLRRLEARRAAAGNGETAGPRRPLRARARHDLGWLKFFDGLSVRLCLAPPAVDDAELPGWADRDAPLEAPDGTRVAVRWEGEGTVRTAPPAFGEGVVLALPCRDLPSTAFPDAASLRAAWRAADERSWRLRLLPGGS